MWQPQSDRLWISSLHQDGEQVYKVTTLVTITTRAINHLSGAWRTHHIHDTDPVRITAECYYSRVTLPRVVLI